MLDSGDSNLLNKLVAGLTALLSGTVVMLWRILHVKIESKADKEAFLDLKNIVEEHTITRGEFLQYTADNQRQLNLLNDGLTSQKETVVRVFERLTTMDETSTQRHIDLLNAFNEFRRRKR